MRHRSKIKKLGRTRAPRKALMRSMATSFLKRGRMVSTLPKVKALRPYIEKIITRGRVNTEANRRLVSKILYDQKVVDKLFAEIGPKYEGRPGGYTRILRLGRRKGDAAPIALIELVD